MRRYSSIKQQCYNCHKMFQDDELARIRVIKSDNKLSNYDYQTRMVCEDCLDQNYIQCYHFEEHIKTMLIDLNDKSTYIEKDGNYYCKHCAENYIVKCANCSKILDRQEDESHECDGDYYCDQCFYELFQICDNCGDSVPVEQTVQTYDLHGNLIYVCEKCKDQFIVECDGCGQDIHIFKDEHFETAHGQVICLDCFQDHYFVCDGCSMIYHVDELYSSDDGCYCQGCYAQYAVQTTHMDQVDPQELDQDEKYLYDYGTKIKPKLKKRLIEQETKQYIGVQLQLQNSDKDLDETKEFIQQVSKNRKLICKKDASLNYSGVQINTFPCTYSYHLKSFGWQQVFKVINEYNMTNTSGAGLHFHISKNNFTNDQLKALDYFVNNCANTLGAIGGRDYSNDINGHYCHSNPNKKENDWGYNFYRYTAVNFQNENTVQLRFPASTSNYNEFKKRLRMVHNICKVVKLFSFDDLKTLDEKNLTWVFTEVIKEM